MSTNSAILPKNSFMISSKLLSCCGTGEDLDSELYKEGLQLLVKSKAAVVFISKDDDVNVDENLEAAASSTSRTETKLLHFQELILYYKGLLKVCLFDYFPLCFFL